MRILFPVLVGFAVAGLPAAEPTVEQATHWAFQPLSSGAAPVAAGSDWARTNIDRFVLAALRQRSLEPVGDAPRLTLLRRVHFDLVGLPPTPGQIDAFLADRRPGGFARVVDGLLASPTFGERWARHWLDVARFAESTGGGRTKIYENAWRYRDYVIGALNSDKPYDRFLAEQIAGDLLPWKTMAERHDQLVATGFLLLGPINYELQDKELLRMEVIDEQLDTLGRAMLGLSIGCARCHDHKFDPIPTRDYYALAGIFKSTHVLLPGNVSGYLERPLYRDVGHRGQLAGHSAKVKELQAELNPLKERLAGLGGATTRSIAVANLPGTVVDDTAAKLTGRWTSSTSVAGYVGSRYIHDAGMAKGQKVARFETRLPEGGEYEVRLAYTAAANRASNVPITLWHAGGIATTTVNQRQKPTLARSFVSLGRFRFKKDETAVVEIGNAATDGVVIADAIQWLKATGKTKPRGKPAAKSRPAARNQAAAVKARIAVLEKSLKALAAQAPPPAPLAMAVEDHPQTADITVCLSGDVHSPGESVPRGFLTALPSARVTIPAGQSGRRQLAAWLVGPAGPLTARVAVNRCWSHLFGRGLVATTGNLGRTGEKPTHPALLDHLAAGFISGGWSRKQLIRRIVLSRTYRLASRPTPALLAADPQNLMLGSQRRRRLDAEALRDSLLAISGELEPFAGGNTIRKGTKTEFGYRFDDRRRSIYSPVFRNRLNNLLAVFDTADPNIVTARRTNSTLPTQALTMLNSPWVIDRTRATARRLLAERGLDTAARLDRLCRLVLSRPPTDTERVLLSGFLADTGGSLEAWGAAVQVLLACLDFRYLD